MRPAARRGSWGWMLWFLGLIGLGIAAAAVWFAVQGSGDLRLRCVVEAEGFEVDLYAYLVRPFTAEIEAVQRRQELAREPLRKVRQERERQVVLARGAVEEAVKAASAAEAAYEQLRDAIKNDLEQNATQAASVWEQGLQQAREENEARKRAFQGGMEARARELGLQWPETLASNEPDVVVSAFRLGLYNAGQQVDAKKELAWAEEQLVGWRKVQDAYDARRAEVRERARLSKAEGVPRVEAGQEKLDELDKARGIARAAVAKAEGDLRLAEGRMAEPIPGDEDVLLSSRTELETMPDRYKLAIGRRVASREFLFTGLEKNEETPPGDYLVFVRAQRDGRVYWAFVPVTLEASGEQTVMAREDNFRSLDQLLASGMTEGRRSKKDREGD